MALPARAIRGYTTDGANDWTDAAPMLHTSFKRAEEDERPPMRSKTSDATTHACLRRGGQAMAPLISVHELASVVMNQLTASALVPSAVPPKT
jgi:hypothetical protein